MEFESDPLRVNPWNVRSLEDFLVYSCPECMTFKRTVNAFVEHATNEHPSCHELMYSLGFFEPEPRVKKETLDNSEPVEFVTDDVTPMTPSTSVQPVQPVQLQNELISISQIKTEQEEEESNSFLPLMDIETNNEFSEDSLAPIERVLNVSEHETSTELRSSNVIFFEKLVPAKANIQANIWEDRTEIPYGPKENLMYVIKNFNKDRTGRYKNPSCDYGPWNVSTHVSQYQIKDNALQYMGETENRDFGIKDCEKVVLKSSRCYLQANRKYVKYVTYVKQCPEEYVSAKDYCTVEYVGIDINGPNTKPHRNSKNGVPYKRNNEYMLEEAKDMFKKGKMSVKEVLSELSDSYKGETLPSARALYNMKYQLQKKKEKKKEQEQADFSTDQIKIETDDL